MSTDLHGVLPMLVTPFARDGSVALDELRRVADVTVAEGAHGLSVNGLGGEAAQLTAAERQATARTAIDAAAGLPVVVGASAPDTATALTLADDAAALGAGAIMVAPPPRREWGREQLLEHYAAIASRVHPTSVMVQDAPAFIGVALDDAFIAEACRGHANVRYAKPESVPAVDAIAALREHGGMAVFAGQGGLYLLDVLDAGANGVIPGCEHTAGFVEVWEAWQAGRRHDAEERFLQMLPLLVAEFQSLPLFIASVKTILAHRGLISDARLRDDRTELTVLGRRLLVNHARRAGALNTIAGAST